jgi:hypothetical protein
MARMEVGINPVFRNTFTHFIREGGREVGGRGKLTSQKLLIVFIQAQSISSGFHVIIQLQSATHLLSFYMGCEAQTIRPMLQRSKKRTKVL